MWVGWLLLQHTAWLFVSSWLSNNLIAFTNNTLQVVFFVGSVNGITSNLNLFNYTKIINNQLLLILGWIVKFSDTFRILAKQLFLINQAQNKFMEHS